MGFLYWKICHFIACLPVLEDPLDSLLSERLTLHRLKACLLLVSLLACAIHHWLTFSDQLSLNPLLKNFNRTVCFRLNLRIHITIWGHLLTKQRVKLQSQELIKAFSLIEAIAFQSSLSSPRRYSDRLAWIISISRSNFWLKNLTAEQSQNHINSIDPSIIETQLPLPGCRPARRWGSIVWYPSVVKVLLVRLSRLKTPRRETSMLSSVWRVPIRVLIR